MSNPAAAPRRERLGRERPGVVLHGPPITVRCRCGEPRDLAYGEVWQCADCDLRWDTRQIPREQYQRIRMVQLRYRAVPVVMGLLVAGLALVFYLTGNTYSMFILVPVALMGWMTLLRPIQRNRYRRAIADLPTWKLRPDPSPSSHDHESSYGS